MSDSQVPFLKSVLLKPLLVPAVARALSAFTQSQAAIFLLHRFRAPELGVEGHDPAALRQNLAYLRKQRYDLISLEEMLRRMREGVPLKRAIAFTIDDGYFDQASIAAPVFAEFDCPVTTFVTTGFLDGKIWFWWDQITVIFEQTRRPELRARVGAKEVTCRLNPESKAESCLNLQLLCQDASQADRVACIDEFARNAEVALPVSPPPKFAPLSWGDARKLEKSGMSFGPHTVTHPVLSSVPDNRAEFEMAESWNRLRAEVVRPVPVFCYPVGRPADFGEREMNIARGLGLWGAVSSQPGRIEPAELRVPGPALFRIPRFGYRDSLPHLIQSVTGLDSLKARFRGASA